MTPRGLRSCRVPAVVVVAAIAAALVPATAHAGIGASAVPNFPPAVTVGNAGVPASIELRNTNTDANAGETNTVCNFGDGAPCPAGDPGITLIPSCGTLGAFSACTAPDPGVFRAADVATGEAGTACAGMLFNVSLVDPATGQLRFTPQGGAHVTLPATGSFCRIGFTFGVLETPAVDQSLAAGLQTIQVADNTQFAGALTASARGTSIGTTVNRATPAIATAASPGVTVGGQLTDTAVVTGRVNPVAGATVEFRLYGPDDPSCTGTPVYVSSPAVPLSAEGSATSAPFTPTVPGTYRWVATYSGDANNEPVSGACNDANESATVTGPPTITVRTEERSGGRCEKTSFNLKVAVSPTGLKAVRVTLDGRTIARSAKATFTVRVRALRLRGGRHVIRVIARGTGGTATRTTTFRRCGSPALPRFVG